MAEGARVPLALDFATADQFSKLARQRDIRLPSKNGG